jgi:hypothetical protein
MTFTEAAAEVLRLVGRPLHYKDITEIAIQRNLLSHVGKSPEETMGARLASLLKKEPKDNPLVRLKPGIFALRSWEEGGPPGFAPDNDMLPPYGPGPKKEPARASNKGGERRDGKHERQGRRPRPEAESKEAVEGAGDAAPVPAEASPEEPASEQAGGSEEGVLPVAALPEAAPPAARASEDSDVSIGVVAAEPPEEALAREEALAGAEEEEFHIASPPPTLLLTEEDLPPEGPVAEQVAPEEPAAAEEEEVTMQLPLPAPVPASDGGGRGRGARNEDRRREDRGRRRDRDRNREEEPAPSLPPASASTPAPDEKLRADLVAGAMELFGEEEDDDQPILGGESGGEAGGGRRRRRRRRRGAEGGRPEVDPGLPSYTVSPAFEGAAVEPREERAEGQDFPRREEREQGRDRDRDRDRGSAPRAEAEGDEVLGRDMVDLLLNAMGGFERSGGPVPVRNVAESLVRRGRVAGDIPQVVAMMTAAVRADNARRASEGKRPRFRLSGGRVAMTDWSLSQDLLRLEGEALAAVERYRDASRKALARKLGELPGHAFVELCLTLLERLGLSQFKPVKRQVNGGEAHLTAVLRGPGGEARVGVLIRKDAREIGRERVIEARGSLHQYAPATGLWLLTSGQVLSGAREEAQAPGASPVALFDGVGLAKLCEEHGIGVLRTVIPVALPDLDFFEALRSS